MRIVLVGKAGSGKDTVADYLVNNYGFRKYAFADKMKEIISSLFPYKCVREKPRSLLQNIGTYFRSIDEMVWVDYLLRRIETDMPQHAVISDCRYANELVACMNVGFTPVLIDCPKEIRDKRIIARGDAPLTEEQENHPSETDVFEFIKTLSSPIPYTIENTGTLEELYNSVDELMTLFGIEKHKQFTLTIQRPSWHKTFMDIAEIVARRSTCLRRQVGAVLVKDKRIIATGYNGAPKGLAHCIDKGHCLRTQGNVPPGKMHELCRAVHAEENCIIQAGVFGVSTTGASLYVTHFPCSLCARSIINAGIRQVYYLHGYPDRLAGSLLQEAGIEVVKLELGGDGSAHECLLGCD